MSEMGQKFLPRGMPFPVIGHSPNMHRLMRALISQSLRRSAGINFPRIPSSKIAHGIRLYKTVEGNPAVSHVHRDFLLMRDYAGLAALFMIFFGTAALIEVPSWRASLTYCFVLSVQFLVVRQAASTLGVLGRRSEKQSQTPSGLRPQAPIA